MRPLLRSFVASFASVKFLSPPRATTLSRTDFPSLPLCVSAPPGSSELPTTRSGQESSRFRITRRRSLSGTLRTSLRSYQGWMRMDWIFSRSVDRTFPLIFDERVISEADSRSSLRRVFSQATLVYDPAHRISGTYLSSSSCSRTPYASLRLAEPSH